MALRATGTVSRLYFRAESAIVRLSIPAAEQPKDGYFVLETGHPNYYALVSLVMSAAINRHPLMIRTRADIVPTESAIVEYLVVDW
jgi:hypothetical protein